MNERSPIPRKNFLHMVLFEILCSVGSIILVCQISTSFLFAQTVLTTETVVTNDPSLYGPFNGVFLAGGGGLKKTMAKDDSVLLANLPWSIYAWVRVEEAVRAPVLVAGMGDPEEEYSRYLAVDGSHVMLWMGKDNFLSGSATVGTGKWHLLAATFDGESFHLYSNGTEVAHGKADLGSVSGTLQMAPAVYPTAEWQHFGGKVVAFTVLRNAVSADEVRHMAGTPPNFEVIVFEEGSKPWWVQERGQAGYRAPQNPETMPRSKAMPSKPVAVPVKEPREALEATGENSWTVAGGWRMHPEPEVREDGAAISQSNFKSTDWYVATAPC